MTGFTTGHPRVVDVTDVTLAAQLEQAYSARLTALLEGDEAAQVHTLRDVEDLERRCVMHRQLRELARSGFGDTTYYLG